MRENESRFLKSKISGLIDRLAKLGKADIFEEIIQANEDFNRASENISTLVKLAGRAVSTQRESSLIDMAIFLWTFEGLYVSQLDHVCLLLIGNEHDLFNLINRKYVSSLSEIVQSDISTKFEFLREHGLKVLIRKDDQRLRNKIAHNDFVLDEEGFVLINGKIVDVFSDLKNLNSFLLEVSEILSECAKMTVSSLTKQVNSSK